MLITCGEVVLQVGRPAHNCLLDDPRFWMKDNMVYYNVYGLVYSWLVLLAAV